MSSEMQNVDSTVADDSTKRRGIWILLSSMLAFRIVYLTLLPFDLIHDEAYYWDWSRQLDWCYYSKPPGIAWVIAAVTRLTASTPFFVRLPAAILSVVTAYFAYCLGHRLYGYRTGFFAAALVFATPGNVVTGVMMTIDSPFLCCWSMSLYALWRMMERDSNRVLWTVATAVAVGCGLLCKQTMLAFPVLAAVFVIVSRRDRVELRRASFWLCGLAAIAFLLPVVFWNSQHDWITVAHTSDHFTPKTLTLLQRATLTIEFILSQAGMLSPTSYTMLAFIALLCARYWRMLRREELYLISFWLGPLLAVTCLSFNQHVEANWPAPFYASGIVLLAAGATGALPIALPRWTLRRSLAVGVFSVSVTYLLPFLIVGMNLKATPVDVAARMWGWRKLAHEVSAQLADLPEVDDAMLLVSADRGVAAELAFYLPDQPRVYLWDGNHKVDSQYDIWGLPANAEGRSAVLVSKEETVSPDLASHFQSVDALGTVNIEIARGRRHRFQLWHAREFHSTQLSQLPSAVPR